MPSARGTFPRLELTHSFLKVMFQAWNLHCITCASSRAKSNKCFDILNNHCKLAKMHFSRKIAKVQSVGRHWYRNHHIQLPSLDTTGVYFFASLKKHPVGVSFTGKNLTFSLRFNQRASAGKVARGK